MNERIKELTAQLGEPSTWGRERPIGPGIAGSRWYGWSDHQQERNGYNTPLYDTAQLKKFAELIVAECINREELLGAIARGWCSEKNSHKTMDSDLALAIFDEVERQIKKNFGVK